MMSGDPLILTIELELCLVMTATFNGLKSAHKAQDAYCHGLTRVAPPDRQLPPPPFTYGLCEATLAVPEPGVPVRRAPIVP
jgi:hypothetical protein